MDFDLQKPFDEYADIWSAVTENSRKELRSAVDKICPMWEISLGDFFACCCGDFSFILDKKKPLLWQVIWVEAFPDFVTTFADVCKRLTLEPSTEQKQAAQGCLPMEWQEGILIFARSYFGLPSFSEAENLKLCDFVLAKKDDYNTALAARNMQKIQLQKMKK